MTEETMPEVTRKHSSDGESTMMVQTQLDNLENLLHQADSEVFGRKGASSTKREITPDDMAYLDEILEGKPKDPQSTPTNILHLSTAENIFDVLGLLEEPKRKTKKENGTKSPKKSVATPRIEEEVEVTDNVQENPAADAKELEPEEEAVSVQPEQTPETSQEVVSEDALEEPKEDKHEGSEEGAATEEDTTNLVEDQQDAQEEPSAKEPVVEEQQAPQEELVEENEDDAEEKDDECNEGTQETDSIEVVLPTFDCLDRDIITVASDTFIFKPRSTVTTLKQEVTKLRVGYSKLEQNNKHLSKVNSRDETSVESLQKKTQKLQKQLGDAQVELKAANAALAASKALRNEMENELCAKEAAHSSEVESRLQYRRAVHDITELVKRKCKDKSLVEKVMKLAEKAEEDPLAVPDMKVTDESNSVSESISFRSEDTPEMKISDDTNSMEETETAYSLDTPNNKSKKGAFSYFKACVWTT